jgi:hypothetical protein
MSNKHTYVLVLVELYVCNNYINVFFDDFYIDLLSWAIINCDNCKWKHTNTIVNRLS